MSRSRCPPSLESVPILPAPDVPDRTAWSDAEDAHRAWSSDPDAEELIPAGSEA